MIIHHPAAALHLARVAAAQEGRHVCAVAAALIGTASKVPVLIKDDLKEMEITFGCPKATSLTRYF